MSFAFIFQVGDFAQMKNEVTITLEIKTRCVHNTKENNYLRTVIFSKAVLPCTKLITI